MVKRPDWAKAKVKVKSKAKAECTLQFLARKFLRLSHKDYNFITASKAFLPNLTLYMYFKTLTFI
jgi:hypothetical protein